MSGGDPPGASHGVVRRHAVRVVLGRASVIGMIGGFVEVRIVGWVLM